MPSLAISAALLLLGNSEGLPWTASTWQELTKVFGIPWFTEPDTAPDTPAPNVSSWSTATAQSVKTYAQNLWAQPNIMAQAAYARRAYTDNDAQGRTAWNGWVSANWTAMWKLNRIIDEVLTEVKCGPYDTLARFKVKKVRPYVLIILIGLLNATMQLPTLEDSQVLTLAPNPLAFKLFGDDAYPDGDPMFLFPAVKSFIDHLLVNTWHRYRKALGRESNDIAKKEASLDVEWQALTADGANPSIKHIKTYLVHIRSLMTILHRYQDADSLARLEEKKKCIEVMLAAAQNDDSKSDEIAKLPKALREALKKLATEHEIREIEQLVQAALENIQPDDTAFDLPEGDHIDIPWKEGVEDLGKFTEDELWAHLGLKEKKAIPMFQKYTDPDAAIEPWTDEGERWLNSPDSGREPLRARWHQLVGIFRMLQRAFQGDAVLLMDGVGIGKTFQVIGFIACLAWFRSHFEVHKKFPGSFANLKWQGKDGNIPDLPFLIVCPVSLHHQWQREIERFLKRSAFDVLPYLQRLSKRRDWWTQVKAKSRQHPHRQLILATDTAIQDDGTSVFLDLLHHVEDEPKCAPAFHNLSPRTVFGHEFLGVIIDEAHKARKLNKFHQAVHALRKQSATMIAMSATPVLTHLQDLWIMGSVLGLPQLKDKAKFEEMCREVSRAQAKDRRAERESSEGRLRGLLAGEESSALDKSTAMRPVLQQWIPFLREVFSTNYQERVMLLELREWEKVRLARITDELAHSPTHNTTAGAGKNFYIEFRRGLLHPQMNPSAGTDTWCTPSSLQDWKGDKCSTKLDILAQIVAHHLSTDNAQPLNVNEDGVSLQPDDSPTNTAIASKEPDRIIIFSAFPSSNAAITDVLKLYGVKALELHGKIGPAKRKSVLNEFRSSTRDAGARVLSLVSGRHGGAQPRLREYHDHRGKIPSGRLLRMNSFVAGYTDILNRRRYSSTGWSLVARPDVFLNNIAFDKGNLHKAFVGMDEQTRSLFTGDVEDTGVTDADFEEDDGGKGEETPMDVDAPASRNKKGSKRTRDKSRKPPPVTQPPTVTQPRTVSPSRPATKRDVPFSPKSTRHSAKPAKRAKPIEEGASTVHQSGTATAPPAHVITATRVLTPPSPTPRPTNSSATRPVDDDPLLQQMIADLTWEKDPDELEALAELHLQGGHSNDNAGDAPNTDMVIPSSPLSSLPTTPHATNLVHGVPARDVFSAGSSRSASAQQAAKDVAGVPLIPQGSGTFKQKISKAKNPRTYGKSKN
ncbi:hypothetical protein BKA83DRAFT_4489870 [Pisolithus microcarpus]|nr:hypothetical protein BKA83DRAFT_4489870 [Pisolithus microcarpus]